MSLTSVCVVHSNVYGLGNIHWIRYLTAVNPLLSTSPAIYTYHLVTPFSVHIPMATSSRYSTSIGKQPVANDRPTSTSIRRSTTSSEVSHAEQCSITTNVLKDNETVVLVCCIIEWEPNITCTWEVWIFNYHTLLPQLLLVKKLLSGLRLIGLFHTQTSEL